MSCASGWRAGADLWMPRVAGNPAGHSQARPAVEPRPVAPHRPTPSQSLGQGIDLVVVTSGEGKKFGGEILKPRCPLGKPHRTTREQIGLGNQARKLVGFRCVLGHVDRTLLEALDQALADGRFLDQERRVPVASFDLQNLAPEVVKTQVVTISRSVSRASRMVGKVA